MKLFISMFSLIALAFIACQPPQAPVDSAKGDAAKKVVVTKESLKTQDDQVSYAIGLDVGKSLKRDQLALNEDFFMKGVRDSLSDTEALLTEEELKTLKTNYSKARMEKMKKEKEEKGKKNKEEGEKFLTENKTKEGVVVLESGLQYKILKEGTGIKPTATDRVSVHYKGTLLDGKEFDSSLKRKKPAEFSVNRVVKGWTEALQLMPVGSKWQLFVPADLGYAERGAGRDIGPNAVLIFEIELIEILEAKAPAANPMGMPIKKMVNPAAKDAKPAAEATKPVAKDTK